MNKKTIQKYNLIKNKVIYHKKLKINIKIIRINVYFLMKGFKIKNIKQIVYDMNMELLC